VLHASQKILIKKKRESKIEDFNRRWYIARNFAYLCEICKLNNAELNASLISDNLIHSLGSPKDVQNDHPKVTIYRNHKSPNIPANSRHYKRINRSLMREGKTDR